LNFAARFVDGVNADGGRPMMLHGFETVGDAQIDVGKDRVPCFSSGKLCSAEARPTEIRLAEVRLDEVRPAEVRLDEKRIAEVSPFQGRLAKVRRIEVRPAQVCPAKIRCGKVRPQKAR